MDFSSILLLILTAAVLVSAVLFLIFEIYVLIIGHWKGAPFVRSSQEKIAVMLEMADLKIGEIAVDLGSGDGSLVIEAAKRGGRAVGVEINPFLVRYSRWRIKKLGLENNARIIGADFRKYQLSDADVIFLYLWPETLAKLKTKLAQELKPGARVISNGFPIPGWRLQSSKNGIFIYGQLPVLTRLSGQHRELTKS